MKLEVKKLLYDLDRAIELISTFTQGKQLNDYKIDALLRSGVQGWNDNLRLLEKR
jgi:uncharacterized protein with HEPN domain